MRAPKSALGICGLLWMRSFRQGKRVSEEVRIIYDRLDKNGIRKGGHMSAFFDFINNVNNYALIVLIKRFKRTITPRTIR